MDGTDEIAVGRPAADGSRHPLMRPALLLLLLAALVFFVPRDPGGIGVREPEPETEREVEPVPAATGPALLPATDLSYRVPVSIRPSCVPVDMGEVPIDALECKEGPTTAFYLRLESVESLDAQFDQVVAPLELPEVPGGCRAGIPAREQWRYTHSRNREEGRMACFIAPPDVPVTVLTQPEARLLSIVISDPSLGWAGHFENWSGMVPNPPSDRQPPQSGAGRAE